MSEDSTNKWIAPAVILAGGAIVVALLLRGDDSVEQPVPAPVAEAPPTQRDLDPAQSTQDMAETARKLLVRSEELEAAGRFDEAVAIARQAIDAGAKRDGALQAAKIEILREDYGAAEFLLSPLTSAKARDADAEYNLGLIAQRQRKYNDARAHYLATLATKPEYSAARFNLAVLARDFGFSDEAGHHARAFVKSWPDDPRAKDLGPLLDPPKTPTP